MRLQLGVGIDFGAQLSFRSRMILDDRRFNERMEMTLQHFQAVLDTEQRSLGNAGLLGACARKLRENASPFGAFDKGARKRYVTLEFELRHGIKSIGRSGMTGSEGQVAGLRVGLGVTKKILTGVERAAVTVDPQIGEIEIVAREFEIIGIAAKKGNRPFRRKDQPHILVTAIPVEVINTTAIERDDVAAEIVVLACAFSGNIGPLGA